MEKVGLTEKGHKEAMELLEDFKNRFVKIAQNTLLNLYTDVTPYIESDAWQNYRNDLQTELGGGVFKEVTDSQSGSWAKRVREMILKEHRAALIDAINQDHLKEIEILKEELKQAYSRRY